MRHNRPNRNGRRRSHFSRASWATVSHARSTLGFLHRADGMRRSSGCLWQRAGIPGFLPVHRPLLRRGGGDRVFWSSPSAGVPGGSLACAGSPTRRGGRTHARNTTHECLPPLTMDRDAPDRVGGKALRSRSPAERGRLRDELWSTIRTAIAAAGDLLGKERLPESGLSGGALSGDSTTQRASQGTLCRGLPTGRASSREPSELLAGYTDGDFWSSGRETKDRHAPGDHCPGPDPGS